MKNFSYCASPTAESPDFPYWDYEQLDLDKCCYDECLAVFRFLKNGTYNLVETIRLPDILTCYNGVKVNRIHVGSYVDMIYPVEGKKHHCSMLAESGLYNKLEELHVPADGRTLCVHRETLAIPFVTNYKVHLKELIQHKPNENGILL